jgi:16S rRNA processing protein RimM
VADPGHDLAVGTERLVVALVRGVHGLHGAIRVEVLTDRPETRFVPGAVLYREGTDRSLTVASAEAVQDGPGWRVRFREVGSREAADTLRGAYLEMEVRPTADLARGEVYWHEVLGVAVRGVDGTELGVVTDIYRVAENEVYIVGGGAYGTFDVPAVRAFIRIFAPRRGEIVVDAEALDLRPPKERRADPDRPRAPRRTARKRRSPSDAEPAEADDAGEPAPSDRPEPEP